MKQNSDAWEFSIRRDISEEVIRYKEKLSNGKFNRVLPYIRAGIPEEYWDIDLDMFDGDPHAMRMIEKYCLNINIAKKKGVGFLLTGPNGVGKTTLMMSTLKEAISKGHSAFYMTLADVFQTLYLGFDCKPLLIELRNYLRKTDFVAIGDLGKDYHRKDSGGFVRAEFDVIFRYRRSRHLPTLMDTNFNRSELENTYGESLMSLFASKTKIIKVEGIDYRKAQAKEKNKIFNEVLKNE